MLALFYQRKTKGSFNKGWDCLDQSLHIYIEHISSAGNPPHNSNICMICAGTIRTVYSFNRTVHSGYPAADATNSQ